jgi:hypothetical protein
MNMAPVVRGRVTRGGKNAPSDTQTSITLGETTNKPAPKHDRPMQVKPSEESPEAEDKMLDYFEVFGEDDFAVVIFFWLSIILASVLSVFFILSLSWITAAAAVFAGFILVSLFYTQST